MVCYNQKQAPAQSLPAAAKLTALLTSCSGGSTQTDDLPGASSASRYEEEVIRLVNEIREDHGLEPLSTNSAIMAAAHARLKELDLSPSHTRPDGTSYYTILPEYGLSPYAPGGENLAFGYRTPQEAVNGWMNSPGHRANILKEGITLIGVGYNPSKNYWVQVFTH